MIYPVLKSSVSAFKKNDFRSTSADAAAAVGGNSVRGNFFASLAGSFIYFVTLTEAPILQGLIGSGMGKSPALALLLAGLALSLLSILVSNGVMGWKKTAHCILVVVAMATISGLLLKWLL